MAQNNLTDEEKTSIISKMSINELEDLSRQMVGGPKIVRLYVNEKYWKEKKIIDTLYPRFYVPHVISGYSNEKIFRADIKSKSGKIISCSRYFIAYLYDERLFFNHGELVWQEKISKNKLVKKSFWDYVEV